MTKKKIIYHKNYEISKSSHFITNCNLPHHLGKYCYFFKKVIKNHHNKVTWVGLACVIPFAPIHALHIISSPTWTQIIECQMNLLKTSQAPIHYSRPLLWGGKMPFQSYSNVGLSFLLHLTIVSIMGKPHLNCHDSMKRKSSFQFFDKTISNPQYLHRDTLLFSKFK